MKIVNNNNVVKIVGNFEGEFKTSGSTIINGDGQFDSMVRSTCRSGNSTKKDDQFVVGRDVLEINIEVFDIELKGDLIRQ